MSSNQKSEIDAVFQKAEQFRESGKHQEALQEYTRVVYFAPQHWPSYFHLGTIFGGLGHNELAVSLLRRSGAINPDDAVVKNHTADYLIKLNRDDEAIELLKESWALDSKLGNLSAPFKVGKIYWETNRPAEAIAYFDQVLDHEEGQTDHQEVQDLKHVSRWYRGLCRMSMGDYQEAWDDYESRDNIPGVITPDLPGEKWLHLDQDLQGKSIFFAYEQRFGDVIQFIRFLPRLTNMGAKVIVQLPPELDRQVRHSFPDIEVVSTNDPLPSYDYHQLVTSIPAVLNLNKEEAISDPIPYFSVNDADRKSDLPMRNGTALKVGLVWEGKPDPDRSIPLTQYIPLLQHHTVSFYSFQLGEQRNSMHTNAAGWLIHDLAPNIADFYDSSVMLKEMDLLITIDTAIAHQAGALDVPVWVMLRFYSDWRWDLDRDDNDWYPSMRLFRQHKKDDWHEASLQLEQAFNEWVPQTLKEKQEKQGGAA